MRAPDGNGPRFFLVGGPKCGTTSLYNYLRSHPGVFLPEKELQYFGADLGGTRLSLDEYLNHFRGAHAGQLIGEASVRYLASITAAEEIKRFEPNARILIMVRNPVEAIASMHADLVAAGLEEEGDLRVALAKEESRRQPLPRAVRPLFYLQQAAWGDHVARWLRVFGHARVHVVLFDDFAADVAHTYSDVLAFLDLPPHRPDFKLANARKEVRSRAIQRLLVSRPVWTKRATRLVPEPLRRQMYRKVMMMNSRRIQRAAIPSDVERRIVGQLEPDIRHLSHLIGRDLSDWLGESTD